MNNAVLVILVCLFLFIIFLTLLIMGMAVFGNKSNENPGCSCNSTTDCPVGQYCSSGKCLCYEGASCAKSSDCGGQGGLCVNGICKINTTPQLSFMA